MVTKAENTLIQQMNQRGANISQGDDGDWHASYIWDGQEFTLDHSDLQSLVDDTSALIEINANDDTYVVDFNEDAERYIVEVNGIEEPFTDESLAVAFAAAKAAVMEKQAAANAKAAAATKPSTTRKPPSRNSAKTAAADEPAVEVDVQSGANFSPDVQSAFVQLANALRALVEVTTQTIEAGRTGGTTGFRPAEPMEGFVSPEEAAPAPVAKKRGFKKS